MNSGDIKDEFRKEFAETVDDIRKNYSKTEEDSRRIVGTVICNLLKKRQIDTDERLFLDFYKKYIHNLNVLSFRDFTNSELKRIIDETPRCDDDKKIAYKLFVERKNYNQVSGECYIADPRTVGNNKERISNRLKQTASKLYKN